MEKVQINVGCGLWGWLNANFCDFSNRWNILQAVGEAKGACINKNLDMITASGQINVDCRLWGCDPSKIGEAIDEAKNAFGNRDVDIFYNNVEINEDVSPFDYKIFMDTMEVNVGSVLASIKHAGDEMRKNKSGGCILCTGTTTGLLGDVVPSAYSISKTAVLGLVRAAAADLASHGVRVNAISPHRVAPRVDKSVLKQIFPKANDKELDDMIKNHMTNRQVTEVDVANAAVYLASDASKSVTGHNLVLDGSGKFTV